MGAALQLGLEGEHALEVWSSSWCEYHHLDGDWLTCFRGVEEEALEDLGRHPRLGVSLGLDVALGLPGVVYCILCVYCTVL